MTTLRHAVRRHWAPVVFGSVVALAAVVVACAPTRPAPAPPTPAVSGPIVREEASGRLASDRVAMVALEGRAVAAPVSATGEKRNPWTHVRATSPGR